MKTALFRCVAFSVLICFSLSVSAEAKVKTPKFLISASAGPNGKLKPKGNKQAKQGTSKTYTATPNSGFQAQILLDGQIVASGGTGVAINYTLSNIMAAHTIQAQFVTPPPPIVAGSNNISIIGFGNTSTVTNHTPVTISGIAAADVGLSAVQGLNVTTGMAIPITGKESWSTSVALNLGDNLLRFTSVANGGSQSQVETTITYYPALDFTSALEASHTILFTNSSTQVNFTIGLTNTVGAMVRLFQTNAQGALLNAGTEMFDNGTLPDEIQSDGVFTTGIFPSTSTAGFQYFRVGVTRGASTFYSEVVQVWVTEHFVNGQIDLSIGLANGVEQTITTAMNQGQTEEQAAMTALTSLKSNPNVGAAGLTPEHGVWWVSQAGILGLHHGFKVAVDQRARSGIANQLKVPQAEEVTNSLAHQIKYYAPEQTGNYSATSATDAPDIVLPDNRIKSRKGLLISPFKANPKDVKNSFGSGDDYFGPWQTVKTTMAPCKLYPATELLNDGAILVTRNNFTNVSDYGYIHICSHGDNYYNGLLSLWKDVWGPKDFLKGSLSQAVVFDGEFLSELNGEWNFGVYEEDIKAHRVAFASDGAIVLLPSFFNHYLPQLPNSLVVLAFCRSAYNNSLVVPFLNHGAGAVIGFTNYVRTIYVRQTVTTVLQDLYMDKTVLEGAVDAVTKFGVNDKSSTPAFFTLYGAADLKLAGPDLQNGGFEDGILSNWNPSGDGRVIRKLGGTLPIEGQFMGIISTGLGFTTNSGSIRQDLCVPANATTLTFQWNFFSEEFLTFCNTQFQDFFVVKIHELDMNGQIVNTTQVLQRKIDDLCGSVSPSDVGFDQGDVYNTGWIGTTFSLTAFQGKHVIIEFTAGDVGDSIYDTAILIDDVKVNKPTP
jgi:hypothetical protein